LIFNKFVNPIGYFCDIEHLVLSLYNVQF